MNACIIGLLAETPVHPGAGQSAGFVDLPVAREAATDYPVVVGTSIKGALKDHARKFTKEDNETSLINVFGKQDNAGALLVSDAKLALLPVRSLTGQFRWLTCPHLLERLIRDCDRAGILVPESVTNAIKSMDLQIEQAIGGGSGFIFLEERQFELVDPVNSDIIEFLSMFFAHTLTANNLEKRLVIVSDDDFAWFARYGLSINARNQLDEKTKQSKNLWYEETIPTDSLFYTLLAERSSDAVNNVKDWLRLKPYIQLGGNETVGQGWFATKIVEANKGA